MSENLVSLTRSETRNEKGEVIYRKQSATVQLSLTPDEAPLEKLHSIQNIIKQFEINEPVIKKASELPKSNASSAQPGSIASITDEKLLQELEELPWRPNSSGKGEHILLEDIPMPFRPVLLGKFITNTKGKLLANFGEHNYTRFGDDNEWIGRFHNVKQETTK